MPDKPDQQDALFVNLVLIFQNAAMQQMGKISNPVTGKIERNLEQARFSIDVIDMLKAKTRGNLSSDLEKLLDSTLTNLRMNYVDEANKETPNEEGEKKEEDETSEEGKAEDKPGAAGAESEGTAGREDKTGDRTGRGPAQGAAGGSGDEAEPHEDTEEKDESQT